MTQPPTAPGRRDPPVLGPEDPTGAAVPGFPAGWPASLPGQSPDVPAVPSALLPGPPSGPPPAGEGPGLDIEDAAVDRAAGWSLWWSTLPADPGTRLHVWRVHASGLNVGVPQLVLALEDGRRLRLDDYGRAVAYLLARFGPGRYRITPRTEAGGRLAGTQSYTLLIEDTPMHLPMHLAGSEPDPVPTSSAPGEGDAAIEIERLRIQAEMEREREARRERFRETREERRREREAERERRRDEERKHREEEDRRRSDREMQMHTMMIQVLKEVAGGRDRGKDDTLLTTVLAKLGQPDPVMLKLLDTTLGREGRRDELSEFTKAQAESLRLASSIQTDSLRHVMAASQEVQSQLIRQAVEVASTRDNSGGGWDGIGQVLSAAAGMISALRLPAAAESAAPRAHEALPTAPPHIVQPAQRQPTKTITEALRLARAMQRGAGLDDREALVRLASTLPEPLADAIRSGDAPGIQRLILPAIRSDADLAHWLGLPDSGPWIATLLERVRTVLIEAEPGSMVHGRDDEVI